MRLFDTSGSKRFCLVSLPMPAQRSSPSQEFVSWSHPDDDRARRITAGRTERRRSVGSGAWSIGCRDSNTWWLFVAITWLADCSFAVATAAAAAFSRRWTQIIRSTSSLPRVIFPPHALSLPRCTKYYILTVNVRCTNYHVCFYTSAGD